MSGKVFSKIWFSCFWREDLPISIFQPRISRTAAAWRGVTDSFEKSVRIGEIRGRVQELSR